MLEIKFESKTAMFIYNWTNYVYFIVFTESCYHIMIIVLRIINDYHEYTRHMFIYYTIMY